MNNCYGYELIIDLKDCEVSFFTRDHLKNFCVALCKLIDMTPADIYFWDYGCDEKAKADAPAHLAGTTVVQFIETSDIRIHTLDKLRTAYINIFSCKSFSYDIAVEFSVRYFGGKVTNTSVIKRGVK